MKVIEIERPGGPEVLRLAERPKPELGAGEVLVRVLAAGVNRPDVTQRIGQYPPPPGASDLPGLDIAGVVEAVADDVTWPRPGDAVCALVTGGGYAEYCKAPALQCLPLPKGYSFADATTALTAQPVSVRGIEVAQFDLAGEPRLHGPDLDRHDGSEPGRRSPRQRLATRDRRLEHLFVVEAPPDRLDTGRDELFAIHVHRIT